MTQPPAPLTIPQMLAWTSLLVLIFYAALMLLPNPGGI